MKLSWSTGLLMALAAISEAAPAPAAESRALPLVQSNQLRRVLLRSELQKKGQILQDFAYSHPGRNRFIGSPGHNLTVNYLYDTLVATGYYDVSWQQFNVDSTSGDLKVQGVTVPSAPMSFSPGGSPSGPLTYVLNVGCNPEDYPIGIEGRIALISRGTCTFATKSSLAKAAGAAGAVIYNNVPNAVLQGTLGGPGDYVPTFGISQEDGVAFRDAVQSGNPRIAQLNLVITTVVTYNVIAETKEGDHNNVLALGAHTDSVEAGPGINDNGSGSIGILEVALQLTKFSVNNAVRFGWWSGEEEGLLGSTYYVENLPAAEQEKIRVYLNFDMIASPNFVYEIYDGDGSAFGTSGPPGSAEVEKLWEEYFPKDAGLPFNPSEFDGRSDYGPFLEAGIAAGGLTSGADGVKTAEEATRFGGTAGITYDPNYHSATDILKNTNVGAWIQITKGIAHAVATYARSWEGFPVRALYPRGDNHASFNRKGDKWVSKRGDNHASFNRKGDKWVS